MAYITQEEITTHLGADQIEVISDGDDTALEFSIDAAIKEAKGYLQAFDIVSELTKTGSERNSLLMLFIKDLAVWHFVNICNVNTSMELRENRYNRAIAWLKDVQKGNVIPDLPEKVNTDGESNNLPYKVTSNPKRTNHV
jgi:phage gp36-like protein